MLYFILGAELSADGVVRLTKCDGIDLSVINTAHDCITAAANPEVLPQLEHLVSLWCKQIEQVRQIKKILSFNLSDRTWAKLLK